MDRIVLTLKDVLQVEPAIRRVAALRFADPAARLHCGRLLRVVQRYTEEFRTEHTALVKQMGQLRDPAQADRPDAVYEVPPARVAAFLPKVEQLLTAPAPIAWPPLSAAELATCPDATPDDLAALGPLFDWGEE